VFSGRRLTTIKKTRKMLLWSKMAALRACSLVLLVVVWYADAQCSLADSCDECLNIANPSTAKFCTWFEDGQFCEEGW